MAKLFTWVLFTLFFGVGGVAREGGEAGRSSPAKSSSFPLFRLFPHSAASPNFVFVDTVFPRMRDEEKSNVGLLLRLPLDGFPKKYLAEDPNDECPIREAGRTNSAIINVATTAANFAPQKSSKAFFFWRTKFAAK